MIEFEDYSEQSIVGVTAVDQTNLSVFLDEYPHIHLHTIVTDWEALRSNKAVSEMCCHACKTSIFLIYVLDLIYKYPEGVPSVERLRDEFTYDHAKCAELPLDIKGKPVNADSFKTLCPSERKRTSTVDLSGL